ncbi:GPI transamidase component PIG-S-like [Chenopodium quinoa]|uniref:GPI transamidase component PIG-S-like n=1 Tax=Chenopodium quinoa TaxID=63459 RepID=UPI000B7965AB|nr:GPI transamidase component PIG-S-like [Chenopodium quinoa]
MPDSSKREKLRSGSPTNNPGETTGISAGESQSSPENQSESFDSSKMRKTKPGIKRLLLTLSVLFSFILGFPFLLKSVEIYRSPLPFKYMDSLSSVIESEPLLFPCRFQAVFLGFSDELNDADKLGFSIAERMREVVGHDQACGSCRSNFTVSVSLETEKGCMQSNNGKNGCSWQCGLLKDNDFDVKWKDDEYIDGLLENSVSGSQICADSKGKVYSVIVVKKDEEVRAVVGKHRHGWIIGKVSEAEAVERIAEIFVRVFMNGGKEEGSIHGEFMPVGADGRVVLSFSLLNSNPHDWIYDWNFQRVNEIQLAPIVEALAPLANISVESQILYHTPKSFFSYWDDQRGAYIYDSKDLPFFVNSNEWHLDTSIAAGGRSKILHIVVYIPSAKECPLLLQLPNGEISMTNGFISPMWGGVIVWNPSGCSGHSETMREARHTIPFKDLENIAEVFMGQLRQLFGLKSESLYAGPSGRVNLLTSERGFTEWELDLLARQHTCFNLQSCATTLGSLSRLVQSLPRMIIKDEIGKQVQYSLHAANFARSNATLGAYDDSAVLSRQARSLAEDAFFHPSIMSVSYYSFEHCFAVYSPFFLPVALHVLLAAFKEWKRYKQEKLKYLTWKAKEVTS